MAKLVMDCEAGCARVNLEVLFQPAQYPPPREQQQPRHQGHRRAAGPARQRRRVRRAQAREAQPWESSYIPIKSYIGHKTSYNPI